VPDLTAKRQGQSLAGTACSVDPYNPARYGTQSRLTARCGGKEARASHMQGSRGRER